MLTHMVEEVQHVMDVIVKLVLTMLHIHVSIVIPVNVIFAMLVEIKE